MSGGRNVDEWRGVKMALAAGAAVGGALFAGFLIGREQRRRQDPVESRYQHPVGQWHFTEKEEEVYESSSDDYPIAPYLHQGPTMNAATAQIKPQGRPSRGDKKALAVLKSINDDLIKFQKDKDVNQIIKQFVEKIVIEKLRNVSSLFNAMYSKIYFTGSYYDGLKVKKPDEFDLNIVLDLSLPRKSYKLEYIKTPGFVALYVEDPDKTVPMNHKLYGLVAEYKKRLVDSKGDKLCVMPQKVKRWMQSLFAQIDLTSHFEEFGIDRVAMRTSGPAFTLNIFTKNEERIDVDLVPAFSFLPQNVDVPERYLDSIGMEGNGSSWYSTRSSGFQRRVQLAMKEEFFIVPKGSMHDEAEWRIDFHNGEEKVMRAGNCVKPVIRLLKLFRSSNQVMQKLSSYSLKTVVINLIRKRPNDDWEEAMMDEYFLQALEELKENLEDGKVPYFFDSECNVLWNMGSQKKQETARWLDKLLKKLKDAMNTDSCRQVWEQYFKED